MQKLLAVVLTAGLARAWGGYTACQPAAATAPTEPVLHPCGQEEPKRAPGLREDTASRKTGLAGKGQMVSQKLPASLERSRSPRA